MPMMTNDEFLTRMAKKLATVPDGESVDTTKKKGWAYTSYAQVLVYYIPPTSDIYIFSMADIKMNLLGWKKCHKELLIPNNGYNTLGFPIPLTIMNPLRVIKFS